MAEKKKANPGSYRLYDEEMEEITKKSKELDISQAELVALWRKSYERLNQEQNSRQSENLKTLRSYVEKIQDLFITMTNSTEEIVKNEQEKTISIENQYKDQVIKTNDIKKEFEAKIKEQKQELDELKKELQKYEAYEENVEGRIADKDKIITAKDENILSLTEEIQELKEKLKEFAAFEEEKILLENDIENLKDNLKQKELDNQRALLDLRTELQNSYSEKIQVIYEGEANKRDQVRNELEERFRVEKQQEISSLKDEHQKEIERVRAEYEKRLADQEDRFTKELAAIEEKQNKTNKKA